MWSRWIPAVAGIALIRLFPPAPDPRWPDPVAPYREAVPLLLAGIAFAAVMPLLGGEPAYTVVKLALLLGVPAGVFLAARRWPPRWRPGPAPADAAHRWGPALPVAVWLVLSYATPLAVPASERGADVQTGDARRRPAGRLRGERAAGGGRWLQTRWESLLGRWPAIVLASLVWAAWHVAIQGTGRPGADLATVVVNHGVLGLFLGYLWSRYRRMWPLLVVHGAVNAMPVLLGL
ncbi:CPBP family intramembrane glutamic endopeptidase [Micromonospora marina]|uniref:CPBP family intramembrane glutamic endopeptidase n=1 Tax=Micromonospora marina TaxID=307120 RepID=UPI003453ECB1